MTEGVSFRRAFREIFSARGLAAVVLVGTALQAIPSLVWVALPLLYGYRLSIQRGIRLGETGLPPLATFPQWIRRGAGAVLLLLPLLLVLLVVAFAIGIAVGIASTLGSAHITLGTIQPLMIVAMAIAALTLMPFVEVFGLRYAVYDRVSEAFHFIRAIQAVSPHGLALLKILGLTVAAAAASLLARYVVAPALGLPVLTGTRLFAAVLAHPAQQALVAFALHVALTAALFLLSLVSAHLYGQLALLAYPLGAETGMPAERPAPLGEEPAPAEEAWG
jgi:hypothetical protein